MASTSLFDRMLRAAKLETQLYEEVEADTTATAQALMAVVVVSLATGIGSGIAGLMSGRGGLWFLWGLFIGLATSIVGWIIWSFLAYIIGTKLFGGTATWGELLRTIGFSNSPGALRIFSFIPVLGAIISFATFVWILIAGVIAIRQALDFSTGRAVATAIIGWLVYILIVVLTSVFVLGAAALF